MIARLTIFWNLSRNEKPVIKEVDKMNNEIKIFEGNQIRSVWDNEKEGNELATICSQQKLKSPKDGKMYNTDVADMQGIFRIIQSVPSPKAEPFKMWLAEVGKEISKAWSGMTTREYKDFKRLKKQNLRDNMSTTELILNMLAETATKDIVGASNLQGLEENRKVAKRGGNVAKVAKETLEQETGEPVITPKNAVDLGRLISDVTKEIPKKEEDSKEDK